jgi:ribosomal protein L44E
MDESKEGRGGSGGSKSSLLADYRKIRYAIILAIRNAWSRYDPHRKSVKDAAKVQIPMRNKDGSVSKRYGVAWKCSECGELRKDTHVHHDVEVGAMPNFPFSRGELEDWVNSLFCGPENLRVVCESCHKKIHGRK